MMERDVRIVMRAEAATATEDDEWAIEGRASLPGMKADGLEIPLDVLRSALPYFMEGPHIFGGHFDGPREVADEVVGKVTRATVDDNGLWVRAVISRAEQKLWTKINEGLLTDFSIEGKARAKANPQGGYTAEALLLRGIAIVPRGMDKLATFEVARSEDDPPVSEAPHEGGQAVPDRSGEEAAATVAVLCSGLAAGACAAAAVAGGKNR